VADSIEVIMSKAEELKSRYAERDELYDELEQMTFLDWSEKASTQAKAPNVKITISPDARNQFLAAVQLMSATEPKFRVPEAKNMVGDESKIEKFVQSLWTETNKIAGTSLLYDLIFSAMLYGESHLAVTDMNDYVGYFKKRGKAYERRAKRAAAKSPFMFKAFNPHECYTDFDDLGLTSHYRRVEATAKKVAGEWGQAGIKATKDMQDQDKLVYNEWWDLEKHCVWLDEGGVVLDIEHDLPFIPIETAITDGSQKLFSKISYQRQPFLYGVAKSGLWDRQNLTLSALYTLIFAVGFSPLFAYTRNHPGKELEVDFSKPFNVINLDQGEGLSSLARNLIDPAVMEGMNIANSLVEDSTIYRTARGQTVGANAAYSTHALLTQAGRLPLITPQRRIEWLLSQTMEKCMERLADGAGTNSAIERMLDGVELSTDTNIETALDVRLPQDKLQAANIATSLKAAGIVSDEWIMSGLLQIEQPEDMRKQIMRERFVELQFQQFVQKMAQQEQMAMQQQQMQMQQAQQAQAQPQAATMQREAQMAGGAQPGMEEQPTQDEMMAAMAQQGGMMG